MSVKIRLSGVIRANVVVLVTAFTSLSLCQNAGHPKYEVANLLDLPTSDCMYYADQLGREITSLSVGCAAVFKDFGHCCEAHGGPPYCEVVYVKIEDLSDKRKRIRVYVIEYLPSNSVEGELVTNLTCSSSTPAVQCYSSLLKRIALAVKDHDVQCHSGRKCHVENMKFVPD